MKALRNEWKNTVESYIYEQIDQLPEHQKTLKKAMKMAIESGGKRIRPMFVLNAVRLANGDVKKAIPVAASIEMIHTYSLIHDDLPGLDNDDLRRGKPTLHVAFDEATAILAGDAFLTLAFEVLTNAKIDNDKKIELVKLFSQSAGGSGMIAGQMLDIASETQILSLAQLQQVHHEKTGKLFDAAILSGLLFGTLDEKNMQSIKEFSHHFGLAFQIHNDLQDSLWDSSKTGKETGKDSRLEKNTYVSILTIDGAKTALNKEIQAANQALDQLVLETPQQQTAKECFVNSLAFLEI